MIRKYGYSGVVVSVGVSLVVGLRLIDKFFENYVNRRVSLASTDFQIDNDIYDKVEWHDQQGPFVILKNMNSVRVPFFKKYLSHQTNLRTILDIGCGGGFVSEELAMDDRNLFKVTGIDKSVESIEEAKRHANERGLLGKLKYVVGDAYFLPFENESFDGVVLSDVLEHFSDLPLVIREVRRVLRKGGVLVFDTINRSLFSYVCVYGIFQEIFGVVPSRTHDWKLFIRPDELEELLKENGFDVEGGKWTGIVPLSITTVIWETLFGREFEKIQFMESKTNLSGSYQGYATRL